MKWTTKISSLIKDVELRKSPVIVTVNTFDEKSAKEFQQQVAQAHNTGQRIIPVIIDSYGGQVYSLMSMISAINYAELLLLSKERQCRVVRFYFLLESKDYDLWIQTLL